MIFSDYCRELEKPQKEFGGGEGHEFESSQNMIPFCESKEAPRPRGKGLLFEAQDGSQILEARPRPVFKVGPKDFQFV